MFTTMTFTVLVTCEIATEILPYKTKTLIEDLLKFPVCKKQIARLQKEFSACAEGKNQWNFAQGTDCDCKSHFGRRAISLL